jgi:hypothetical protein
MILTIIVPIYNEADNLIRFYEELSGVLIERGYDTKEKLTKNMNLAVDKIGIAYIYGKRSPPHTYRIIVLTV